MEKYDIYWITWKNQEAKGKDLNSLKDEDFTIRPGLILDNDIIVTLAKITTHSPRAEDKYDYSIVNWKEAGLTSPSTIRFGKKEHFISSNISPYDKIGHLSNEDISNIKTNKLDESIDDSKEKPSEFIADLIKKADTFRKARKKE